MNKVILMVLLAIVSGSAIAERVPAGSNNSKATLGTDAAPLAVKVLPDRRTSEEVEHDHYEQHEKPILDRWVTYATVFLALVTAVLAFFTYGLWKDAREASAKNMHAMRDTINESTRAANAMERLAANSAESISTLKQVTAQQMRAYVTVIVGNAIFQERGKGLKFAGKPRIVNTGHTPAHDVGFKINAAILPVPLPDNFNFPLPETIIGAHVLGPGHFNDITGVVPDYIQDIEVNSVKLGIGKALYTWGIVTYKDVFGVPRETKFCQSLAWIGEGTNEIVYGFYNSKFNEAT
jgi:hypothetical protein